MTLHKLIIDERLTEIARELASRGFGIFMPYERLPDYGVAPLEGGKIAHERGLDITYSAHAVRRASAEAVGWRWNGAGMEVFADCCADGNVPDISDPIMNRPGIPETRDCES